MKTFKFTNPKVQKIIIDNYRNNEDIYLFEKRINEFLKLINEDIPSKFIFSARTDEELIKIPVEETYKIVEGMRDSAKTTIDLVLHITAYKLNFYLDSVLKGLNEDDMFPYFPIIRAILEHICFSYMILYEAKKYSDLMNTSVNDIIAYIKNYGSFDGIIRLAIFGTKNQDLINESIRDNRIDEFSVRKSIEYVVEKSIYKQMLDLYKYFSELTHPSSFSFNYFLSPDGVNIKLVNNNILINKNQRKNIYSLNTNSLHRISMYFEEIIYLLTYCMELFQEIYSTFYQYNIDLPNTKILKDVKFKQKEHLEIKKFLESKNYLEQLRTTYNKNKFKSSEKFYKEVEKIVKKKEHEINKNG